MAPHRQYTLEDFKNFGKVSFPIEFASVADVDLYKFDHKTCIDDDQQPVEGTLLCLGRYYHSKSRGPLAWASATASGIAYHSGKPGRVCKPVPALLQARIYHDYPFNLMFTSEGFNRSDHDRDPTQMIKESVLETMICFAFLLTGRLDHMDNVKGTDMFSNFKFACMNFHRNKGLEMRAEPSFFQQPHASKPMGVSPNARHQARQNTTNSRQPVNNELSTRQLIPAKRTVLHDHSNVPDPSSPVPTGRTSVIDHLVTYEASIRAEAVEEIQTLRTKLATQKARTVAAKDKFRDQKEKRQDAETQLEEMKVKLEQSEKICLAVEETGNILSSNLDVLRRKHERMTKQSTHFQSLYNAATKAMDEDSRRSLVRWASESTDSRGRDQGGRRRVRHWGSCNRSTWESEQQTSRRHA